MPERIAGVKNYFAALTSASEFAQQTFVSASHRPMMIPAKDRFENRRQPAQQRFVGAQSPIESDKGSFTFGRQRPFAAADKIACGFDFDGVWFGMLDDFRRPAQPVWQPAFGKEMNLVADVIFAGRRRDLRGQTVRIWLPGKRPATSADSLFPLSGFRTPTRATRKHAIRSETHIDLRASRFEPPILCFTEFTHTQRRSDF